MHTNDIILRESPHEQEVEGRGEADRCVSGWEVREGVTCQTTQIISD